MLCTVSRTRKPSTSTHWSQAHLTPTYLHNNLLTFPRDLFIGLLELQTHGFQQFVRVLQLYLLTPSNYVDKSKNGIVEVLDSKAVDGNEIL